MSSFPTIDAQVIVLGDVEVERTLYFIGDRAVDLRPAWFEITWYMQDAVREQFASEGGRGGSQWEPLSSAYAFRKWNKGQRLEILRATDAMYEELTGSFRSQSPSAEWHDTYMTFGGTTEEFKFQQGNTGAGDMPVRRPIELTDADVRTISGMIMDRIIFGSGFKQNFSRSSRSGKTYYSKRGPGGQFSK